MTSLQTLGIVYLLQVHLKLCSRGRTQVEEVYQYWRDKETNYDQVISGAPDHMQVVPLLTAVHFDGWFRVARKTARSLWVHRAFVHHSLVWANPRSTCGGTMMPHDE